MRQYHRNEPAHTAPSVDDGDAAADDDEGIADDEDGEQDSDDAPDDELANAVSAQD